MDDAMDGDEVLGEGWFPVGEVSVESLRERASMTALPPTYYLHVWFARRPLTTSRAAILSAILPPDISREYFLSLNGIPTDRDVIGAHRAYVRAKAENRKIPNPFTWKRAFSFVPSNEQIEDLHRQLEQEHGSLPVILDPFGGGGSIPLEAVRLGLPAIANDLNPIAYLCMKGTVEYPVRFGEKLIPAVKQFSDEIHQASKEELKRFYPMGDAEDVYAYLWCRTVSCPHCGLIVPLSPNWWISNPKKGTKIAVRPVLPTAGDRCDFSLVENPELHGYDPDLGTTSSGGARCIRCNSTIESGELKTELCAGRMGYQIYTVCTKIPKVRGRGMIWQFRPPNETDYQAASLAEHALNDNILYYIENGWIPTEEIPDGDKTRELLNNGITKWRDLFNPRQLLAHAIYAKNFSKAKQSLFADLTRGTDEWEFATTVAVYSAFIFDSAIDYNSVLSLWHPGRNVIAHTMALQAFPFKQSFAEWNQIGTNGGYEWTIRKVTKSIRELLKLLPPTPGTVSLFNLDAANLPCGDCSIPIIITDPPYSNNVMYAEVSDFFYVWLKRLVGDLFPEEFADELTNKVDEAVANTARFSTARKGHAKLLADQDYASKMEAAFRGMHRLLTDDGVLCVMFTHRQAEAWESLAESLMNAGFVLRSSWPVHTEPGDKFGKADKGALKVTVLLFCRKRPDRRPGRWEDVVDEIRQNAKEKVVEYQGYGITGPDLLVSLYGPALGRFSEYYPVKDIYGNVVHVSEALAVVAQVVNEHLTGDIRGADMESLAYLNLLRSAPTLTMETDLARLSTVFGGNTSLDALDVKGGAGLVKKEKGKVKILTARQRVEEGVLSPDRTRSLKSLMDVVHAAILLYEQYGIVPVQRMLGDVGRDANDAGVLSVLGAISAIGEDGAAALVAEARIANALLEALGHTPAGVGKTGEKITHWT